MEGYLLGAGTAILLGLQTAISPCPMATNVAAITFLGRRVSSSTQVLLAGLLYALGRAIAYVAVAVIILGSLAADTELTSFLRGTINTILGPVLIVAAMFMLGLIQWSGPATGWAQHVQKRTERWVTWSALVLGMAFALAFCPLSATLFFSLIPIAARCGSTVGLPAIFGVTTALPVVVFAVIIAYSAKSVGKAFNRMAQIERWLRWIAGLAFLLAGLYFTLVYIWDVPIPLPGSLPSR